MWFFKYSLHVKKTNLKQVFVWYKTAYTKVDKQVPLKQK